MQDVFLSIKGLYTGSDIRGTLTFETQGKLNINKDKSYTLEYENPEINSADYKRTCISFKEGYLSLTREGEDNPLVFEENKAYLTDCRLDDMKVPLLLYPIRIDTDIKKDSGNINLQYLISIEGNENVRNIELRYSKLNQ